jgi:ABC-2 type transport system permease protein
VSALGQLRFARALVATNVKATFALRGAFWLQAVLMAANNLVFFSVWWIFFDRFQEIGGWRIADMTALYGIVALGFGASVVLFGGTRDLARTIADGDLDPFLSQPKDPLLHAAGSRSFASGWGDVVSGIGLLVVSGYLQPAAVPVALLGALCGTVVFTATGILFHSLAFWMGPVNDWARQMWEFVIIFSVYPQTVYGPLLRAVLFTVIPAGFIGFLPVELLRGFTPLGLAATVGGAAAYGTLAVVVFRRGLRRYASGNRFGVRA